jgi:hypothetical protein
MVIGIVISIVIGKTWSSLNPRPWQHTVPGSGASFRFDAEQ